MESYKNISWSFIFLENFYKGDATRISVFLACFADKNACPHRKLLQFWQQPMYFSKVIGETERLQITNLSLPRVTKGLHTKQEFLTGAMDVSCGLLHEGEEWQWLPWLGHHMARCIPGSCAVSCCQAVPGVCPFLGSLRVWDPSWGLQSHGNRGAWFVGSQEFVCWDGAF